MKGSVKNNYALGLLVTLILDLSSGSQFTSFKVNEIKVSYFLLVLASMSKYCFVV